MMEIIEFTDKQVDSRYYYKGFLLSNEYKHIKGLHATYVSCKHEWTGWCGGLDQSNLYANLVMNHIEYTFYLPQFDVYRIYRNDIRKKTKFATMLDNSCIGENVILDCIVDPSKDYIHENMLFIRIYNFKVV